MAFRLQGIGCNWEVLKNGLLIGWVFYRVDYMVMLFILVCSINVSGVSTAWVHGAYRTKNEAESELLKNQHCYLAAIPVKND